MTDDAELYAHEIAAIKSMKRQAELQITTILQALSDKSGLDVVGVDVNTVAQIQVNGESRREVISDVRIKVEMP